MKQIIKPHHTGLNDVVSLALGGPATFRGPRNEALGTVASN